MQNFRALGAPSPDSQTAPPLRISGYAPAGMHIAHGLMHRRSLDFELG